ncbi:alpha-rhamnosidase [Olivibacter sp. SDN3]|uniref:alpha-L-rhamnosidase-related protein n=1 Tax=Olivibacter sp. SDN3 TaxID=2764720 RepID=UPI001651AE2B|nr:alpha-L-rhamnosidase C-terminal domain-containing protein [Olivibacter sp. SDN3]QNL52267.1 alpha-rhamnosidase [Olivibacter sp. SDN3]
MNFCRSIRNYLPVALLFLTHLFSTAVVAQGRATWVWYPGDFEIWLSNQMQNKRTERGTFFPPFWRMDNPYTLLDFHKVVEIEEAEDVDIYAEGQYHVKLDGKMIEGYPKTIHVPAGKHKINLKVYAQDKVPAIYLQGKKIVSDSSWLVTDEDKEWIDETGKASDQSGTTWVQAGSWNFDSPADRPSKFRLATRSQWALSEKTKSPGILVDFGKETFGFIKLHGLQGAGKVSLYYGESEEEALAIETCETLDRLQIDLTLRQDSTLTTSKAFRYVYVVPDKPVKVDSISMLYEYLPLEVRGSFRCSDDELNRIWEVSKYTMELTSREFFIDGIKRDRWIWSGDAYQSYLMNYYLFFDSPSVRRTTLALRGKEPVSSHINTIMDYTFYWFLGIYDYYLYTGDQQFIKQFYPRMQSLMEFCLQRKNEDGFMEGLAGDWVFVDWAEGLSKAGELSFEQLLFCRSLETMALCANLVGDGKSAEYYKQEADQLKQKIFTNYWNEQRQAFVHSRINGKATDHVTRYTNMFAIFFDYLNTPQQQEVKKGVLLNQDVPKITTPYMRFYELEALCALKEQQYVLKEIKNYWGGMLALGATSFWEEYDPQKEGEEHYAMYGRPFGKSLCHAWGASPIYLLGKYFLGVRPTSPGYETYLVEPELGGLKWMEGKVPTPDGSIEVYCSKQEIRVQADEGRGILRVKSKTKPTGLDVEAVEKAKGVYEITLSADRTYTIKYDAVD